MQNVILGNNMWIISSAITFIFLEIYVLLIYEMCQHVILTASDHPFLTVVRLPSVESFLTVLLLADGRRASGKKFPDGEPFLTRELYRQV